MTPPAAPSLGGDSTSTFTEATPLVPKQPLQLSGHGGNGDSTSLLTTDALSKVAAHIREYYCTLLESLFHSMLTLQYLTSF